MSGDYTDVSTRNFNDAHDIFFCDTERGSLSFPVTTARVRNRTLEGESLANRRPLSRLRFRSIKRATAERARDVSKVDLR